MAKLEFDFKCAVPPENLMGAMLDFTERRPDLWPGLDRKYYEVYEVGETSAVIREGSGAPFNIWARERYDWSTPWQVSWVMEESNFCNPGSGVVMTVKPASDGGSDVHVEWERTPSNLKGRIMIAMGTEEC